MLWFNMLIIIILHTICILKHAYLMHYFIHTERFLDFWYISKVIHMCLLINIRFKSYNYCIYNSAIVWSTASLIFLNVQYCTLINNTWIQYDDTDYVYIMFIEYMIFLSPHMKLCTCLLWKDFKVLTLMLSTLLWLRVYINHCIPYKLCWLKFQNDLCYTLMNKSHFDDVQCISSYDLYNAWIPVTFKSQ